MLYPVSFLLLIIVVAAWMLFTSATNFSAKAKYIYIRQGEDAKEQVLKQLDTANLISRKGLFTFAANTMKVWGNIKPGRFEIKNGESILAIARTFQKNRQAPVVLNVGRVRTKEGLARLIGKNFITDSASAFTFLSSNDSLQKLGVDTNTWLSIIIPKTYNLQWNDPVDTVLNRFKATQDSFWNKDNRIEKAASMGFTPLQVTILASIVEEETSKNEEKGNIASVYINRFHKNMALGADPTIKFALKDFGLKRILFADLAAKSPYNTYINKGLPPGPICTPTPVTIDAVLNAPATQYLFFVAKSDFSGYHHFSSTFAEHQQYAKEYQTALDELMLKKQNENQ